MNEKIVENLMSIVMESIKGKEVKIPFEVGKAYFLRTVTYHLIGRVKAICGNFIELENASWVADSGRFMQAITEGKLNEIEPVGQAFVNTDSITDAFPWVHSLEIVQK